MRAYACVCTRMCAYACVCVRMRAYACACVRMRAANNKFDGRMIVIAVFKDVETDNFELFGEAKLKGEELWRNLFG